MEDGGRERARARMHCWMTEEDTKPLDEDELSLHYELSLHWVPCETQVNGGPFERGPKAKYETQKLKS